VDPPPHVRIATVELERDALVGPCRVGDVSPAFDEELVLETRWRKPVLLRPAGDERLPRVTRPLAFGMQRLRMRNATAQPGRFECLSSTARRRSVSGFTRPRTIALSTIAVAAVGVTRCTESSNARTGTMVRSPSTVVHSCFERSRVE